MMNLNSVSKKWLYRALIMLIFIFAFALRVHHLSQKEGFHIDEVLSVPITTCNKEAWSEERGGCAVAIPLGESMGKEMKDRYLRFDPSFESAVNDVFKLWKSTRDSPHTNFYYTLLRLSFIGMDYADYDEFADKYIFRAGALNLILFSLTFLAFWGLLRLIAKDKSLILLGLCVAFFNTEDISHTLFFRPYVLQGLCVIIFTVTLIWVSQKIEKNDYKASLKNMFLFAIPLSFMLLSGYYSFVYAFFIGLFFCAFILKKNNALKLFPFFFVACILAVFIDLILYLDFFAGFVSRRVDHSVGVASKMDFRFLFEDLNITFYTSLLLFLVYGIVERRKKLDAYPLLSKYTWIVAATFISSIIMYLVNPCSNSRYVVPFAFIMSLSVPILLSMIKNSALKGFLYWAISIVFFANALPDDNVLHKYKNYNLSKEFKAKNIVIDENEPIVIYSKPSIANMLLRLDDNRKYIICRTRGVLPKYMEDKISIIGTYLCNSNLRMDLSEFNYKRIDSKAYKYDFDYTHTTFQFYFDLYVPITKE